jgi:hypothetical protein
MGNTTPDIHIDRSLYEHHTCTILAIPPQRALVREPVLFGSKSIVDPSAS